MKEKYTEEEKLELMNPEPTEEEKIELMNPEEEEREPYRPKVIEYTWEEYCNSGYDSNDSETFKMLEEYRRMKYDDWI